MVSDEGAARQDAPINAAEVPPKDVTAANTDLGELRTIHAEVARAQADLDANVAKMVAAAQAQIESTIAQIPALELRLTAFADRYRSALAVGRGRAQTIKLPNGELGWKLTILSIDIEDEKLAMADIRRRGWLKRFTEMRRVIVKDKLKETLAALSDARQIRGIRVNNPMEVFGIKPAKIELKTDTKLKIDRPTEDPGTESGTGIEIIIMN